MQKQTITNSIRKLTVGNTGRIFAVGSVIGNDIISKVEENFNYLIEFGERQFFVFTKDKDGKEFVWNEVTGHAVIIEYDKNSTESIA
jgi:hypothetical protein